MFFVSLYIYIYNVFFKNNNNNKGHYTREYLESTSKVRFSTCKVLSQYAAVLEKYCLSTKFYQEVA